MATDYILKVISAICHLVLSLQIKMTFRNVDPVNILQFLYLASLLNVQVLGLEVCADTMVGDEMLRGISGGQKKRVTTG